MSSWSSNLQPKSAVGQELLGALRTMNTDKSAIERRRHGICDKESDVKSFPSTCRLREWKQHGVVLRHWTQISDFVSQRSQDFCIQILSQTRSLQKGSLEYHICGTEKQSAVSFSGAWEITKNLRLARSRLPCRLGCQICGTRWQGPQLASFTTSHFH